jgi:hypothetical protein
MGSFRFRRGLIAAHGLFLSASLCAQQPAPQEATPTAAQAAAAGQEQSKTVLFEGTAVRLRFAKEVSSANAQVGDMVNFDTIDDVRLGGVVVIARGSHALGKVITVVPKRHMGRAGKLDISVEYVRLSSGEKLALSGSPEKSGKGHQGRMAGAMVATGIIIWPAAPFLLFMHGKDITIPAGQEISVYTAEDFDITKAKGFDAPSAPATAPTDAPATAAPPPPSAPRM